MRQINLATGHDLFEISWAEFATEIYRCRKMLALGRYFDGFYEAPFEEFPGAQHALPLLL